MRGGRPAPLYDERKKTAGTAVGKENTMRKRNKTISIRCTDDEYSCVHRKAEQHGLKLNEFVLKAALGKKIIVAEGLAEVVKQQKAVGNNLNQLVRLAHEGRVRVVDLKPVLEQYTSATALLANALREVK